MEDIRHFCGVTDTLFWTSGVVCPGFQSQGRSLACVLCPMHEWLPRLTSGVTAADLLMATIVDGLFDPCVCRSVYEHWWDSGPSVWLSSESHFAFWCPIAIDSLDILRPVYTKRQWLVWSISTNTCIISDQLGLRPNLDLLTWFIKKSKQFNQSDISSHILALTLAISV